MNGGLYLDLEYSVLWGIRLEFGPKIQQESFYVGYSNINGLIPVDNTTAHSLIRFICWLFVLTVR